MAAVQRVHGVGSRGSRGGGRAVQKMNNFRGHEDYVTEGGRGNDVDGGKGGGGSGE